MFFLYTFHVVLLDVFYLHRARGKGICTGVGGDAHGAAICSICRTRLRHGSAGEWALIRGRLWGMRAACMGRELARAPPIPCTIFLFPQQ